MRVGKSPHSRGSPARQGDLPPGRAEVLCPSAIKEDAVRQETIRFPTSQREQIVDITGMVADAVAAHGDSSLCALYARGATAAIMIQENCDPNIGSDILACLGRLAPEGQWLHDSVDDNGAAHIKAGIIGPSETIPVKDGKLLLSRWQNIFFCEFDGPRREREVVVTLL